LSLRAARQPTPLMVVVGAADVNAGAGAARNAAVRRSSGAVLVIQVRRWAQGWGANHLRCCGEVPCPCFDVRARRLQTGARA
jgi:hypothetical protein